MTHLGSPHDAYDFVEQIGDGSFGTVHKAQNKISHKLVAVKVMKKKYSCIEECQGQFEPKLLDLLPPHLNIVQLYDSFLCPTTCDLSFVMEYMDGGNLYQLMRERRHHNLPFNHRELRSILHQILSAVSHIHHHNVFHRDMKPENLLLDYSTGKPIIKLADFGLARELASSPPYTEYVSTRWYRAPEVLLRSTDYSAPVDLWAIGAIFAELITLEPLFPGESEIDQIYRICDILGSPGNKVVGQKSKVVRNEKRLSPGFARKKQKESTNNVNVITTTPSTLSLLDGGGEWKEGVKLAFKIGFKFPQLHPRPLESIITNATESMLDLIRHFLFFNPCQRWSADFALRHAFFSETDEPVHAIVPIADAVMQEVEPVTPPDKQLIVKDITPLDLLPTPKTPYQVCPDWQTDHPVSRYGRLCSAVKDERVLTSSRGTHVDRFLHDTEPPSDYLIQSRPIYSSHQKVHPVTDRPTSSHLWNKYNYASHQQLRPSTPIVDHRPIPTNTTSTSKRVSIHGDEQLDDNNSHRRGHHNPHHHIHPSSSHFSLDRIPHYGNQLIKWAPPQYAPPVVVSKEEVPVAVHERPESRRCRTPAPFSSQLMKHKYTSISHTTSSCNSFNTAPIKTWSPASTTSSINTDKVLADQHFHHQYQKRKSDKPQSTHRNSTSHRFNLWVPATDDDEEGQDEDDYPNENNNRSVVL